MASIIEIARLASSVSGRALEPFGYVFRSSGTKLLELTEPLSAETGYWATPPAVSSKPPRWVLQLRIDEEGRPKAQLASGPSGELLPGSATPGYVNNGLGTCAVAGFRVLLAVEQDAGDYLFPEGWEWIVEFAFPTPLPAGTSGDALTDFSPERGTIHHKGRSPTRREFGYSRLFLHPSAPELRSVGATGGVEISYRRATSLIGDFLGGPQRHCEVIDLLDPDQRQVLFDAVTALQLASRQPATGAADASEETYLDIAARIQAGERGFLAVLATGVYRVAPPLATRGTASLTAIDPGEAIE
jgi:hypothetical protein